MANYADLLGRIELELNRRNSPYTQQLATTYSLDRIYFFGQSEFLFPSEKTDTTLITKPSQAFYTLPAGTLSVNFVRVNLNGTWVPLTRVPDYMTMLLWDVTSPPALGVPSYYGQFGNQLRIYVRPSGIWTMELTVESQPLPPRLPTDSNVWTNEAATLIVQSSLEEIYRNVLNAPDRAAQHEKAKERELEMLRAQTMHLLGNITPVPYL